MIAHIAVNVAKLGRSAHPSIPRDIGTPIRMSEPMWRVSRYVASQAATVINTTATRRVVVPTGGELAGSPVEWSKVSVVLSARLIPIDTERMEMALRGISESEPGICRVH